MVLGGRHVRLEKRAIPKGENGVYCRGAAVTPALLAVVAVAVVVFSYLWRAIGVVCFMFSVSLLVLSLLLLRLLLLRLLLQSSSFFISARALALWSPFG